LNSLIDPRWTGICGALATSSGVEDGTGKVQPFLNIDRGTSILQSDAHLLCDRPKQIVEISNITASGRFGFYIFDFGLKIGISRAL